MKHYHQCKKNTKEAIGMSVRRSRPVCIINCLSPSRTQLYDTKRRKYAFLALAYNCVSVRQRMTVVLSRRRIVDRTITGRITKRLNK